jgi:hypothetical protein
MAADKDNRKADLSRSEEPVRDSASSGSARRDLVPVSETIANKPLTRSRLSDSLFVAHLFATRFQEPQTREKRRADPADANASYRNSAKRPARTGRFLSKKI